MLLSFNLIAQNNKINDDVKNEINTSSSYELKSYKIKGKLIDQQQRRPLEHATIWRPEPVTEALVTITLSYSGGDFSIKLMEGIYDIKFEYISYESKSLTNFKLDSNKGNTCSV